MYPEISKHPKGAIANYGFEPWIVEAEPVAKRYLDSDTIAYLYRDPDDHELFAIELVWQPAWRSGEPEGWVVQNDWVGPFESVEEFLTDHVGKVLY